MAGNELEIEEELCPVCGEPVDECNCEEEMNKLPPPKHYPEHDLMTDEERTQYYDALYKK